MSCQTGCFNFHSFDGTTPEDSKGMSIPVFSPNEKYFKNFPICHFRKVLNSIVIASEKLTKGSYILRIENDKGTFNQIVIFE